MKTEPKTHLYPGGDAGGDGAPVTAALAALLYARAARLSEDWACAGLSDDFDSRMIEATLRYLTKVGRRRPDGLLRTPAEHEQFAVRLLERFWMRNARRDAARRSVADDRLVPLDDLADGAARAQLWDALAGDGLAGETGRAVARVLQAEMQWPCERAWAFVITLSAVDYDDASHLLAQRFEKVIAPATLRQWTRRYFQPVLPLVAAFLKGHYG